MMVPSSVELLLIALCIKKKLKINDVLYILKITVYMKKEYSDVKKLKILKDN